MDLIQFQRFSEASNALPDPILWRVGYGSVESEAGSAAPPSPCQAHNDDLPSLVSFRILNDLTPTSTDEFTKPGENFYFPNNGGAVSMI